MRKYLIALVSTAAVAMTLAGCNGMMGGGGNSMSSGSSAPASASDNSTH